MTVTMTRQLSVTLSAISASHNKPQQATASHSKPQQATASHSKPRQATANDSRSNLTQTGPQISRVFVGRDRPHIPRRFCGITERQICKQHALADVLLVRVCCSVLLVLYRRRRNIGLGPPASVQYRGLPRPCARFHRVRCTSEPAVTPSPSLQSPSPAPRRSPLL